jgi:hypothetical protein
MGAREERIDTLEAENAELRNAGAKVCEGFEEGAFCRDLRGDEAPDWGIKLLPYLQALGVLQAAREASQ